VHRVEKAEAVRSGSRWPVGRRPQDRTGHALYLSESERTRARHAVLSGYTGPLTLPRTSAGQRPNAPKLRRGGQKAQVSAARFGALGTPHPSGTTMPGPLSPAALSLGGWMIGGVATHGVAGNQ
jgi:hypothetical protein